jgi:hypothetical protein
MTGDVAVPGTGTRRRAAGRPSFAVERFAWTEDGLLEVAGRWSGMRGRRFMRPSLVVRAGGRRRRLLAVLDHEPWPIADDRLWVAAFRWAGEPREFDSAELAVAPDVVVPLEPPAVTPATRGDEDAAASARARAERHALATRLDVVTGERDTLADHLRALTAERHTLAARVDALAAERDDALRARDAAMRERDAAVRARDAAAAAHAAAVRERDAAVRARETADARRAAAEAARDRAVSERDAALEQLRAALRAHEEAAAERDALRSARDAALAARDEARAARDAAVRERNEARADAARVRRRPVARPAGAPRPAHPRHMSPDAADEQEARALAVAARGHDRSRAAWALRLIAAAILLALSAGLVLAVLAVA